MPHLIKSRSTPPAPKPQGQLKLVMDIPTTVAAERCIAMIRQAIENEWPEVANLEQQALRATCAASIHEARVVETDPSFLLAALPKSSDPNAKALIEAVAVALYRWSNTAQTVPWDQVRLDPRFVKLYRAVMDQAISAINVLIQRVDGEPPTLVGPGGQ